MKLELNGKTITIPDTEIEQLKSALEISTQEAVELWLDDNGYTENEEQEALDEKAKKVKIPMGAREVKEKKERKPITKKVSNEKQELFRGTFNYLTSEYGEENVKILNENKLIQVKISDKVFKIDVIEQRPPKK